jgi:hypothetical protein
MTRLSDAETARLAAVFTDLVMKAKDRTADRAPALLAVLEVVLERPELLRPGHGVEVRKLAGVRRDDVYFALHEIRALAARVSARALEEGREPPLPLPTGERAVPRPGDSLQTEGASS